MAEIITVFDDKRLNQQFGEFARNLTHENIRTEDEFFILTDRATGDKYRLYMENGTLKQELV